MGHSYIIKNNNNNNNIATENPITQSIIRTIIDNECEDCYDPNNKNSININENEMDNDKNSLLNSNKDSCSNSSVSSTSITDLSNVLVNCKDEENDKLNLEKKQILKEQENEKVECEHYNYAKLFFLLGLIFYFPLIYSIMYIREPNKNVKSFAKVALVTLILYPAFLILITLTTKTFDNGKYWDTNLNQWLIKN